MNTPKARFGEKPTNQRSFASLVVPVFPARFLPTSLIAEALCWSHARRKFFELADIAANARRGKNAAPISPKAVKRIDAIFKIEREINGVTAEERLAARRSRSAPLVAALEEWTRSERAKLSPHTRSESPS